MKVVERFTDESTVRGDLWGDIVKRIGLEEPEVVHRREVLQGIVRMLLTFAGEFGLFRKQGLV